MTPLGEAVHEPASRLDDPWPTAYGAAQVTRKSGSRRWMLFAGLAAVVTLVAAAAFFPHTAWTKSLASPGSRLQGSTSEGRKSRASSRIAAKALAESTTSGSGEYSNAPVVKGVWLREVRPEDMNAGAHDFHVDRVEDTDSRRLEEAEDGKSDLVRAVEGLLPEGIRKSMDDEVEGEDYTPAAKKYKRATSNVEKETQRSQWDWLEGLFTGDILVPQRSMSRGGADEGGWQGSQEGGVVVDWNIPKARYFPPEGGSRETRAVPRIIHRADGRILQATQPLGYVLPYRAPTRSIVFRPCKKHPVEGCEVEPELPPEELRPQMPAEPPIRLVHHEIREPTLITGPSGVTFDKALYDTANEMCEAKVELHDKDVEELVDEANTVFRTESFKAYAVNVFRRVKNKCKMTKGAMDIVEGVILQHSAGGGEAPVAVEPGAHI